MDDPSSGREFQSVLRGPLPPSSQASSEEALSEIKSAVLAKLVRSPGQRLLDDEFEEPPHSPAASHSADSRETHG